MVSAAGGIFLGPHDVYQRSVTAKDTGKEAANPAAAMVAASAKIIGKFHASLFKGTMVDIPLAVAEGMRAAPKLYGEEVQDHENVTDWKSGARVAGKANEPSSTMVR
jgi:hypothetical protein